MVYNTLTVNASQWARADVQREGKWQGCLQPDMKAGPYGVQRQLVS